RPLRDHPRDVAGAEQLAAGGLRRRFLEVGLGEEAPEERLVRGAGGGEGAAGVVATAEEAPGERVYEHVGGAGVEGVGGLGAGAGGEHRQVGDAAEVEEPARLVAAGEEG